MPTIYYVGLAIGPKKQAQWLELGLQAHANIRTVSIATAGNESAVPLDLWVIDGDNPGPNFLAHYQACLRSMGLGHLLVLGQPGCPALMMVEWDPQRTVFVAKPYAIEDVLRTILQCLEKKSSTTAASTASPQQRPPAPPTASSPRKSLGYLSTLKLADLLQMLCMNGWTGRIDIENLGNGENGTVHIRDGNVVDAQQGSQVGESACYRMLAWGRCQFEFTEDAAPLSQTVTTPWQAILLEGARLYDEGSIR